MGDHPTGGSSGSGGTAGTPGTSGADVTATTDVLLIGGGVASASAAVELRRAGFDGSITLLTRELDPPYHRPPITKELLGPRAEETDLAVLSPRWWAENDVELRTRSAVMSLDTTARRATLANKDVLGYTTALLATGATVRRLPIPGATLPGVHYLRAPGNARKLREQTRTARRAVLVGGSFIATETAASLTALGIECTMVIPEPGPLWNAFGPTVSEYVGHQLRERGVRLVCDTQVIAFTGAETVAGVRTGNGEDLPADLVVAGCGAAPDTKLAAKAGLALGETGGIACDSTLRTSAPGHFAAGDVCEYHSAIHGRGVRIEHEKHAVAQGVTAAHGLMGAPIPHGEVPYFWTDLADWARLEYVGAADTWDTEKLTGSLDEGRFTVWYWNQGRLVAALTQGRPQDLDTARKEIRTA